MSVRVRFAPSPTGSLDLGDALSGVASRAFADEHGGTMLLRIDDTGAPGGGKAILEDLEWLGLRWDEGPLRQSERDERYREAAAEVGDSVTHQLASVVDDGDFGITHVIRGNDHRPDEDLDRRLHETLGTRPPEYLYHGLILGPSTLAGLRDAGIPGEAVRRYLEELGLPRHDVQVDLPRIRRLAIEAIARMGDEELAERAAAPLELVPALRGARDLAEARESVRAILEPERVALPAEARPTLERFGELRSRSPERLDAGQARSIVRELKAVGGDLRQLRRALTGRDRGPELWAVVAALPREEALRRARLR